MKKYLVLILTIVSIMLISVSNICFAEEYDGYEAYNLYAKVIQAGEEEKYNDGYSEYIVQKLKVEIIDSRFKGEQFDIIYYLEDGLNTRLPLYDKFKVGDKLYVYGIYENGNLTVDAASYYDKIPWIVAIVSIYAILIALIGGKKGLKALIGLVITVILIFNILVPAILNGYNSILITVLICSLVILITFLIISGFKRKTWVAIIGTVAGVVMAGLIGGIFGHAMRLTGINEHARMISVAIPEERSMIDFKDVMLSAIMISALGACMDVGMSIASAISEIKEKKPDLTAKDLIKSGMNIGKDVMGTMTNTLILAYVGSAMLCILLYNVNGFDLSFILNSEDITVEVLKSLSGSIGLVCTIPLTAIFGGVIIGNSKIDSSSSKKESKEDNVEIPVNYFKG